MPSTRELFVGGPHDGLCIPLSGLPEQVRLPIQRAYLPDEEIEYERYARIELSEEQGRYVYVHDSVRHDVLGQLLARYSRAAA